MNRLFRIAITLGDPGGIGPEIILKSLAALKLPIPTAFLIIGIESVIRETADKLGINLPMERIKEAGKPLTAPGIFLFQPASPAGRPAEIKTNRFAKFTLRNEGLTTSRYKVGQNDTTNGRAAFSFIKEGTKLALAKNIDALVTAPVNKESISRASQPFSGHTEYLAQKSRTRKPVMMFVTDQLKVALVTTHIAYKKVSLYLNQESIMETVLLTDQWLKGYFGITAPRLAVCGLNPHAGESGLFGREEIDFIQPAVEATKREGINCAGPFPADTIFSRAIQGEFDAVAALYHDQGLIPVKTLGGWNGAQVTLGLPFIRTAVMHGTAFDIAGKNKADASSMRYALNLAYQLYQKGHSDKGGLFSLSSARG